MRGGDTTGLRAYNERLILAAIRSAGALSKADLARATGLSAQAASVIVNDLLLARILVKRPKIRGQVGQPQTPIALNPAGAYSVGVKIGRRSVEAVLIDFLGAEIERRNVPHDAPIAPRTLDVALDCAAAVLRGAPRDRVAGVGLAMPGDIHEWAEELGLAPGALDGWRGLDAAGLLAARTGLPAFFCNDGTAACAAELALGDAIRASSALYIYLGAFVGGGLVLDGRLHRGAQGNAAALGSMPMAAADSRGRPRQLIHDASPVFLERRLCDAGLDGAALIAGSPPCGKAERVFAQWRAHASEGLARCVCAAASVLDVETVVLDGVLGRAWLEALAADLRTALDRVNRAGLSPFTLSLGSIGERARVLGAALMPLQHRFSPDPDLVLRSPARGGEALPA
jgi:predicted NBD/HSP70 family sugar kinase